MIDSNTFIIKLKPFGEGPDSYGIYTIQANEVIPNGSRENLWTVNESSSHILNDFLTNELAPTGTTPGETVLVTDCFYNQDNQTLLFAHLEDDVILSWVYKSLPTASTPFRLISKKIDIRNLTEYASLPPVPPGLSYMEGVAFKISQLNLTPYNTFINENSFESPSVPTWRTTPITDGFADYKPIDYAGISGPIQDWANVLQFSEPVVVLNTPTETPTETPTSTPTETPTSAPVTTSGITINGRTQQEHTRMVLLGYI